jgi:hypothetical protein
VLRAKIGGEQYTMGLAHNRDVLASTTTGDDGRFDFGAVPIPPRFAEQIHNTMRGIPGFELLAWGDGRGDWPRTRGWA